MNAVHKLVMPVTGLIARVMVYVRGHMRGHLCYAHACGSWEGS